MSESTSSYYDIPSVPQTRRPLGVELDNTLGDKFFDLNPTGSSPTPFAKQRSTHPNPAPAVDVKEEKENQSQEPAILPQRRSRKDFMLPKISDASSSAPRQEAKLPQRRSAAMTINQEKKTEPPREAKLPLRRSGVAASPQVKVEQPREAKLPIRRSGVVASSPQAKKNESPQVAKLPIRRSAMAANNPKADEKKENLSQQRRSGILAKKIEIPKPVARMPLKRSTSITTPRVNATAANQQARAPIRRSASATGSRAQPNATANSNPLSQQKQPIPANPNVNIVPTLRSRPPQRRAAAIATDALKTVRRSGSTSETNKASVAARRSSVEKKPVRRSSVEKKPVRRSSAEKSNADKPVQTTKAPVKPVVSKAPIVVRQTTTSALRQAQMDKKVLPKRPGSAASLNPPTQSASTTSTANTSGRTSEAFWDRLSKPKHITTKVPNTPVAKNADPWKVSKVGVAGVPTPKIRKLSVPRKPLFGKKNELGAKKDEPEAKKDEPEAKEE